MPDTAGSIRWRRSASRSRSSRSSSSAPLSEGWAQSRDTRGALATAGNLVFFGEADGYLNALNAQTGEKLWHYNLGAGVNAPPVTYEVNGVQYIAVAAGGNFQMNYPLGDAVAIFKLGK